MEKTKPSLEKKVPHFVVILHQGYTAEHVNDEQPKASRRHFMSTNF